MAQDWSVHALVYFYSAGSDLLGAVLNWRLDLELTDMKREDIIEMAGKAFETPGVEPAFRNGFWTVTSEELERFAALVAAAEREACAKVVDHILKEGGGTWGDAIRARGQA
jgi:hypothetical protein